MAKSRKENAIFYKFYRPPTKRLIKSLLKDLSHLDDSQEDRLKTLTDFVDQVYANGWIAAFSFRDSPEFEQLAERLKESAKIVDRIFKGENEPYVQP